jgi:hypothetical protein
MTRPTKVCSPSASVPATSTTGDVELPRSECGLHASRVWLAREGHEPLFRPAGWCFQEGMLTGCSRGGPGAARVLRAPVSR